MSQLALARRYRPRTFQALVGQEVTRQALSNALAEKRLHHAYLFTGTRGVGKTTIARILAKCLNCEEGISATPCDKCSICKAIDEGHFVDLMEVDAASRTKVEDTRELLDNVQYLPTRGRFKIYLIDEVHMLSSHSFNALLKTLEEPPVHVKFLLATTDPEKLPATVLSRCLQFHLWRLPLNKIVQHLIDILQKEKVSFERDALHLLAYAADGSLRDALSLLDQALSFSGKHIETTAVRLMLGLTERERLLALLQALLSRDIAGMLQEIKQLEEASPDFTGVLTEFLTLLHQMAIAQMVPEALDETLRERDEILKLTKAAPPEEIQLYYQIGLQGQKDLPFAPTPKIGFEMILLRMAAFQPVTISNFIAKGMPEHEASHQITEVKIVKEKKDIQKEFVSKEPIKENKEHSADIPVWSSLIQALNLTGLTKALAEHCTVMEWSHDAIHLILDNAQKPLLNKRYEDRLQEALSQYVGRPIRLTISEGHNTTETPAKQHKRLRKEAHEATSEKVQEDPKIQGLIQTFDAKIEDIILK